MLIIITNDTEVPKRNQTEHWSRRLPGFTKKSLSLKK